MAYTADDFRRIAAGERHVAEGFDVGSMGWVYHNSLEQAATIACRVMEPGVIERAMEEKFNMVLSDPVLAAIRKALLGETE